MDFYDKTLNLCIEFNGNAFHPNVGEYNDTDMFSNPFMKTPKLVLDIRKKKQERLDYLRDYLGIHVMTIWEDEYKKMPKK